MGNKVNLNQSWRKMAAAIFEKPVDGKVSGIHDLDLTEVNKAMEIWNANGYRVTVMHVFMSALGKILTHYAPELNCYCQWGKVVQRTDVTVATTVLVGKDLTTVKIQHADRKSILELSNETNAYVQKRRKGSDDKVLAKRHSLSKVPWPIRKWLFQSLKWLTYELGIEIPGTGFSTNMFGSVLVTNIGAIGIDYGIPALMPASNLSFVMALGKAQEKPVVRNGEIVIGHVLPIAGTFDHRIVDGFHISKMLDGLNHYFANPLDLLTPEELENLHQISK